MIAWKSRQALLIFGSYDSRKGKETGYQTITLGEIFQRNPTALIKERAAAIIPSSYTEADAREHKKQKEYGSFVAIVGDIDSGDHSIEEIDRLLVRFFGESASLIYSTSSSAPDNRKWRFIIPLEEPLRFQEWRNLMEALYKFAESNGVTLDKALLRPGQLCYLPNVAPERRERGLPTGKPLFYETYMRDGVGVTPTSGKAPEWIEKCRLEREAADALKASVKLSIRPSKASNIEEFNRANPLADVLLSCDYTQSPHNDDDWQSPHQTSGSYATRVFRDEDGTERWVSLSESDAKAGLGAEAAAGCRYGDAFDLYVHFQHKGDFSAALRTLTPDLSRVVETFKRLQPTAQFKSPEQIDLEVRRVVFGDDDGDISNARIFVHLWKDKLLHVAENDEVLAFNEETGWLKTASSKAKLMAAREVPKFIAINASRVSDKELAGTLYKRAAASSMLSRLTAMTKIGFAQDGMWASLTQFDVDPHLVGTHSGILNIKTQELMSPQPSILVSKRLNVSYDQTASCPDFDAFLSQVQPDAEVRRLLRQLVGIWLYGAPVIQKLIFLYGFGANGKSTFMELFAWLLSDYAVRIPTELLMQHQRSPQGPSPDMVALKGARLAYCNEIGEGKQLSEAHVKDLTGGDTITARPLYGSPVSFLPTHNLVMTGNHKPRVSDNSEGMWRRMLLIGFTITIPEEKRDADLLDKLKREGPGVLNWALAGYADYEANGLCIPASVRQSTAEYRDEQDVLGEFIAEELVRDSTERILTSVVYSDYKYWIERNGLRPLAKNTFTRRLAERGIPRDSSRVYYEGVKRPVSPDAVVLSNYSSRSKYV